MRAAMEAAFKDAKLSPVDIAWFERMKHRRFAPMPPCKLRALAKRAGFLSTVEWLAFEHAQRATRAAR